MSEVRPPIFRGQTSECWRSDLRRTWPGSEVQHKSTKSTPEVRPPLNPGYLRRLVQDQSRQCETKVVQGRQSEVVPQMSTIHVRLVSGHPTIAFNHAQMRKGVSAALPGVLHQRGHSRRPCKSAAHSATRPARRRRIAEHVRHCVQRAIQRPASLNWPFLKLIRRRALSASGPSPCPQSSQRYRCSTKRSTSLASSTPHLNMPADKRVN